MKWAQQHASIPFKLPSMPHLNEEQVVLYKEQVREREEALEAKRKEDSRAMAAEDRAQKEMQRKKRNALKKAAADSVDSSEEETASAVPEEAIVPEAEVIHVEEEEEEDFVVKSISKIAKRREERLKLEAERIESGEASDDEEIALSMHRKRGSNVYTGSQDEEL